MLTIGLVLPDVLGTYGDDGNALVLRQRARMRGIDAEVKQLRYGDAIPESLDIYTVGGGEDTAQILAAQHLAADGGLKRASEAGRPILAICAGLQVLGTNFRAAGRMVDGLGLIDATTLLSTSWRRWTLTVLISCARSVCASPLPLSAVAAVVAGLGGARGRGGRSAPSTASARRRTLGHRPAAFRKPNATPSTLGNPSAAAPNTTPSLRLPCWGRWR